jgi:hypothetical protein
MLSTLTSRVRFGCQWRKVRALLATMWLTTAPAPSTTGGVLVAETSLGCLHAQVSYLLLSIELLLLRVQGSPRREVGRELLPALDWSWVFGGVARIGVPTEPLSLSRNAVFEKLEVEFLVLVIVLLGPLKGDQAPLLPLVLVFLREVVLCHVVEIGFLEPSQ